MTNTSIGKETFAISTFVAFKNIEGSYGPISTTEGCGLYPVDYLYEYLNELIEDGYILDPAHTTNPTDTELFLIVEVTASPAHTGWKVWCHITQSALVAQVFERVLSEQDEATQKKIRNQQ